MIMGKKYLRSVLGIAGLLFFLFIISFLFLAVILGHNSLPFGDKVAVVEVEGIITEPDSINQQIKEYGERDDVKTIVIRINSPGGGVGPSQEVYREIKKVSAKKKVVASMGAVAASGGYYIAAAADKIIANPGTITGSIGVIMEFANAEELFAKIGFKGYVVKSGEYKDIGSPFRGMKDNEKKLLQGVIDDVHKQFIDVVAENRKLKVDVVRKFADGRIFSGAQAKDIGLVDDIGNFQDAIDMAASMANIKGKPIVLYPEKKGIRLWDIIFGDATSRILNRFTRNYGLQYIDSYSINK